MSFESSCLSEKVTEENPQKEVGSPSDSKSETSAPKEHKQIMHDRIKKRGVIFKTINATRLNATSYNKKTKEASGEKQEDEAGDEEEKSNAH